MPIARAARSPSPRQSITRARPRCRARVGGGRSARRPSPRSTAPASPGPSRFAMPSSTTRRCASSAPANSTTKARIGPYSVRAPCGDAGRPEHRLASGDPPLLLADEHVAAALDDDEPRRVGVLVRPIRPPFANASSAIMPRASEWMTWPSTPRSPAGPPAADCRPRSVGSPSVGILIRCTRRAAGERRTRVSAACRRAAPGRPSIGSSPRAGCCGRGPGSAAGPAGARTPRTAAGTAGTARRPGEQAAEHDHQDHDEVEPEDRPDDQQEERDQARPEQPLPHVQVQRWRWSARVRSTYSAIRTTSSTSEPIQMGSNRSGKLAC